MTEAEAKTKWCPLIGISAAMFFSTNQEAAANSGSKNCIGSACMMWQWQERTLTRPDDNGHCGLAGKP